MNTLEKKTKEYNQKSPIREYQEKYCLRCEEQGKCGYERMLLCVSIRLLELKDYQMELYKNPDLDKHL